MQTTQPVDTHPFIKAFEDAITAALSNYGPGYVLLVLAIIVLFWFHEKLWQSRIDDKDKEIARIAEQRDRLEGMFITNRKGTGLDQKGNPPKPKGGQQ